MPIKINSTKIGLLKSHTSPNYKGRTVLTSSLFEFVELWLKRQPKASSKHARYFWEQAKHFYKATEFLPYDSKPLTAYYCCMNAAKTLISLRTGNDLQNITHGVAARGTNENISEKEITYLGSGVLFELSRILGDPVVKQNYKIVDLLYNIPCIHRTYCISFPSQSELFIPVSDFLYVRILAQGKAYLQFKIDDDYTNGNILNNIAPTFERTYPNGLTGVYYRSRRRFDWDIHNTTQNERIKKLVSFHGRIRRHFFYIKGDETSWYIKKNLNNAKIVDRTSLTLIYGVMHWLSELVRYNPQQFESYMSGHFNWLLTEFLYICLPQFVDEICCEITGCEIANGRFKR